MKGNDGIGCLLLAVIVIAVVVLVGGPLVGSFGKGFAEGGGELRAFTVERYASATAGDNGVAVAMNESDGNQIALAYSQPTPAPAGGQAGRSDSALGGFVGALVVGVAFVLCFMYWLMSGNQGSKYS